MTPADHAEAHRELEAREAIAARLKADGYNSSVVARKMITEHGMDEAGALVLVGRLYGKPVSARTGDTTAAVAVGLLLAGFGGLFLFLGFTGVFDHDLIDRLLYGGVVGAGLLRIITALVRAGAPEDLHPDG